MRPEPFAPAIFRRWLDRRPDALSHVHGYLRLGVGSHPALLNGAIDRIGDSLDAIQLGDAR